MTQRHQTLQQFLGDFVSEHSAKDGDEIVIDLPEEEVTGLGQFFIRALCSWALGLDIRVKVSKLFEYKIIESERKQ
jgi:hypothetical protein